MVTKEAPNKSFRPLRFLVTWTSVIYLLALAGVLYGLEHCSERQWFLGALIYLPREGWLLPLGALLPLGLLIRPVVCLLHAAAVALVLFGFDHSPTAPITARATSTRPALTVVTANLGQRKLRTLLPFLKAQAPDLIAFQEVAVSRKGFSLEDAAYATRVEGEFSIASKLRIRNSGIVPDLTFEGRPVAAWFELEFEDRPVIVYSVHMPTPRSYLLNLRGNGFLASVMSGGGLLSDSAREEYQYYWSSRFELARGLLAALKNEKRPVLIVGDFNTPDRGGLYELFTAQWIDSFAAAGSGSGDTFPGDLHGRAAEFGLWLRLDYLFAANGWQPVECSVEPLVRAQHLAVAGTFELAGAK